MKTLRYIFSLLLLLISMHSFSQKHEWKGINVGADLSRFIVPIIDSTRYGWEVSGDIEILKDLFAVVEIGSQSTKLNLPDYSYSANGAYTRLGVDYNYMEHLDPDSPDKLFIGLRYGFTTFAHEAKNITISDDIWGEINNGVIDSKVLTSNWMEVTTGMRANLFNNFYLSWSVRFRINIWQQPDLQMQPYHIPGYGRAWNNSGVGFNYTLSYKIPIIKKRTAPKAETVN
ncbi:MAG: DUF6048 family protein [Prolixibacteraceae bacterium]|nr:DUF6048 family protein [Prolixibacteraceae bacterium]